MKRQTRPDKKTKSWFTVPIWLQPVYIRNNLPYVSFVSLFALLNIVFFAIGANNNRHANGFVIVAKGCGMALNLDCALVTVFMLRRILNTIRNSWFGRFLPIDSSIELHKLVAYTIVALASLHTVMHLGNISEFVA